MSLSASPCCLFSGCTCQPCTQLHAKRTNHYVSLLSLSLPSSCSDKTERKKIRTSAAARGGERTMAAHMITSESGKQQKFTLFAPFCSAVLAVHFGRFNPLCVGPAKMTRKRKLKRWISGLKEANLSSVWSRWRYLKSIRLWLFFFISRLPQSCSTDVVRHVQTCPSPVWGGLLL